MLIKQQQSRKKPSYTSSIIQSSNESLRVGSFGIPFENGMSKKQSFCNLPLVSEETQIRKKFLETQKVVNAMHGRKVDESKHSSVIQKNMQTSPEFSYIGQQKDNIFENIISDNAL